MNPSARAIVLALWVAVFGLALAIIFMLKTAERPPAWFGGSRAVCNAQTVGTGYADIGTAQTRFWDCIQTGPDDFRWRLRGGK